MCQSKAKREASVKLGLGKQTSSHGLLMSNHGKSKIHIKVHHDYHDHALDGITSSISSKTTLKTHSQEKRPARGGVTTPFPMKLHSILEQIEKDGLHDVVSWQPHGRCIIIRKPNEFKKLLPVYFNLSKMTSFQRQLNLYGFNRLTRGKDKGGYYHEFFLRGRPSLAQNIARIKVKGTKVRGRSNPDEEPDFWKMPFVVCSQQEETATTAALSLVTSSRQQHGPTPVSDDDDDDDNYSSSIDTIISSFGGRTFHFLDLESTVRKQRLESCLEELDLLDETYAIQAEHDENTNSQDRQFVDLLEQLITS